VTALDFHLHAASVLAPGIGSLADFRNACRQGLPPTTAAPLQLTAPDMLPANERRRASQVVRLVLGCIGQVLAADAVEATRLRAVFATDEGTGEVCQQMLQALTGNVPVSPLLFANSVLNAPSGYFSIGWKCREPATVLSAGSESFGVGLLCAASEAQLFNQRVLLVCYDPMMTAPLDEVIPILHPIGTAWLISDARTPAPEALATFRLRLDPGGSPATSPGPDWLPTAWRTQAAAVGLAALALIEQGTGAIHSLRVGGRDALLERLA
jgi:hypothetical protein